MKKLANKRLLMNELRNLHREFRNGEEPELDVRLQVYEPGEWVVRFGLSDYDQDHRGYWGAATLNLKESFSYEDARSVAGELISQAEEQFAQSQ